MRRPADHIRRPERSTTRSERLVTLRSRPDGATATECWERHVGEHEPVRASEPGTCRGGAQAPAAPTSHPSRPGRRRVHPGHRAGPAGYGGRPHPRRCDRRRCLRIAGQVGPLPGRTAFPRAQPARRVRDGGGAGGLVGAERPEDPALRRPPPGHRPRAQDRRPDVESGRPGCLGRRRRVVRRRPGERLHAGPAPALRHGRFRPARHRPQPQRRLRRDPPGEDPGPPGHRGAVRTDADPQRAAGSQLPPQDGAARRPHGRGERGP